MTHTVTGKLNREARTHQGQSGMTFFVDIGEANYNFKTKGKEYTNYSAAIFAKEGQIPFYQQALVKGTIISVTGTGIIIDMPDDPQYQPRLAIQDARLVFCSTGNAPQQQAAPQQTPQQQYQQPSHQQSSNMQQPQQQVPASHNDSFDPEIPF